jgi:hypothetical protein
MRIQIIFPYKPDEEIRNSLKRNGFRYSPKNTAWQRHRNNRSVYVAKDIIEKNPLIFMCCNCITCAIIVIEKKNIDIILNTGIETLFGYSAIYYLN